MYGTTLISEIGLLRGEPCTVYLPSPAETVVKTIALAIAALHRVPAAAPFIKQLLRIQSPPATERALSARRCKAIREGLDVSLALKDGRKLFDKRIVPAGEPLDGTGVAVIGNNGWNGCKQTHGGGDQRLGDPWRHHR